VIGSSLAPGRLHYFPNDSTGVKVRIALDTGFLSLPPSGTGLYVRELIAALPGAAERIGVGLDLVSLAPHRPLASRRLRLGWESAGVARAARRLDPPADVVHIPHQIPPVVGPRRGTAEVVTIHDLIPYHLPEYQGSPAIRLRLALARHWLRRASRIIAPSQATVRDIVTTLDIPRHRIALIPLAASPGYGPAITDHDLQNVERIRQRYGIPGRYVFNIGGFDTRKNLPVLVEAFARSVAVTDSDRREQTPVTLVIGGAPHSGNERVFPDLGSAIRRLGLEQRVILTGKVPAEDVLPLHQGATVYCTPSSYEGFGLTPLDAMACGIPVIAANRTSLPEVVADAGLLVEPAPDLVAAALTRVLTDDLLAGRLRNRSLDRAAHFSWELTAEATLRAYQEAMRHP